MAIGDSSEYIRHVIIYDTIRTSPKDALEIIYHVDSFYRSSWNNLEKIITILGGIGILYPIIITYFQKIKFKNDRNKMIKDIDDKIKEIKLQIDSKLTVANLEFENHKNEIKKSQKVIDADMTRLFAEKSLLRKDYAVSVFHFLQSAIRAIGLDNFQNAISCLDEIIGICKTDGVLYTDIEKGIAMMGGDTIDQVVDSFRNKDERLNFAIQDLKISIRELRADKKHPE